jgi:hypothetical protein
MADATSSDTFVLSDAGDATYNGTYTYIGDCNSHPMFGNGTQHMAVSPDFPSAGISGYILASGLTCGAGALDYRQQNTGVNYDPVTSVKAWTNWDGHTLPAPTVTRGSAPFDRTRSMLEVF